ncbi:hypothetical protein ALC57_01106 [Trachymyrmex cornetzi]|uniref:CCHC-type domain-containing protein n=1 Tax=Trachymyrmex cornetzi TaxID=471704 RepID=A0A151JQH0_9HYME|nr:hypothetical protein ALC57_01106 [Trachymyrmex cornetzi]
MTINSQVSYIPSRTLCIKFAGQSLPREISLFNAMYTVEPYVPKARICYVCYRAGHIGKDCKSSKPRCLYCGTDHDRSTDCESRSLPNKCINFGGEHLATLSDCPVIQKHKEIINLAAYENIPHVEAKRIIAANNFNRSSIYINPHNFPYISNKLQQDSHKDWRGTASHNRFSVPDSEDSEHIESAQHMSYAEAAALSSRASSGRPLRRPRIVKSNPFPESGNHMEAQGRSGNAQHLAAGNGRTSQH